MSGSTDTPTTRPLYVRLPADQARRLDAASDALAVSKKDLVTRLVDRYVHPDQPVQLEALRSMAVGHHAFRPTPAEVLDVAQAADLLAVDEPAIVELAEAGEIPGRKIAGQWRFARRALLEWLGADPRPADQD